MVTKFDVLNRFFGYSAFRGAQEVFIDAILSGRDVMGVMPTGAGKSLCYQVPALIMDGVTLVVSPLISLMKDQVAQLKGAGVPAAFINSSLSSAQSALAMGRAESGWYKIIYVAPERLGTESFLSFALQSRISLIAVDEAHCVSQWGQDFRPSYLKIVSFVQRLPVRPVIAAFTATATSDVSSDVVRLLGLRDPFCLSTGFDRANLFFDVLRPKNKSVCFFELMSRYAGLCGVVYCSTRKSVDTVCAELNRRGFAAGRYHAGLEAQERFRSQDDFISGRVLVMVATNAFGMGIDKADVRFVIHYNMPRDMESYYQEAGRAGRDGLPSDCVLLFADDDIRTAEFLMRNSEKNELLSDKERRFVGFRDAERLDKMARYCESEGCLRGYILGYFGEKRRGKCGNCGVCVRPGFFRRLSGGGRRSFL